MTRIFWFVFLSLSTLSRAGILTFDFEGLSDGTVLSNQYAGLAFTNGLVLSAGLSLNELEVPPRSGGNVAGDASGPMAISFSAPVLTFGGYFTYSAPLTLTAFDAMDQIVGSTNSAFSSNSVSSLNAPNELLQLSFAGGISRVTLAGGTNGGTFVVDDLAITTPDPTAVPEPGTILLVAAGLALLRRR